ncbi:c2h2-like zinc finger protein [Anaeramoeba flamelloides]|uniref:C2h2-like zinc finger protein n=1 Tax=Anaeramoeba flamelloides TaxID=1746091 RepID=A0ABQ8YGW3_9EUKA|nr:c2h2-like zinc finger protein [Anaeramoeba flamelloides]
MSVLYAFWLDYNHKGIKKAQDYLEKKNINITHFTTINSLTECLKSNNEVKCVLTSEDFLINTKLRSKLSQHIQIIICSNNVLEKPELKRKCKKIAQIAKNPRNLFGIIQSCYTDEKKEKNSKKNKSENNTKKKKKKNKNKEKNKDKNKKKKNKDKDNYNGKDKHKYKGHDQKHKQKEKKSKEKEEEEYQDTHKGKGKGKGKGKSPRKKKTLHDKTKQQKTSTSKKFQPDPIAVWIVQTQPKVQFIKKSLEGVGIELKIVKKLEDAMTVIENENLNVKCLICGSYLILDKKINCKKAIKKREIKIIGYSRKITNDDEKKKKCQQQKGVYNCAKNYLDLREIICRSCRVSSKKLRAKEKKKKLDKTKKQRRLKQIEDQKKKSKQLEKEKYSFIIWVDSQNDFSKYKSLIQRFLIKDIKTKQYKSLNDSLNFIRTHKGKVKCIISDSQSILCSNYSQTLKSNNINVKVVVFLKELNLNRATYRSIELKGFNQICNNFDELGYHSLVNCNLTVHKPIERKRYIIFLLNGTQQQTQNQNYISSSSMNNSTAKTINRVFANNYQDHNVFGWYNFFIKYDIITIEAYHADDITWVLQKRPNAKVLVTDHDAIINGTIKKKTDQLHKNLKIFAFNPDNRQYNKDAHYGFQTKCLKLGANGYAYKNSFLNYFVLKEFDIRLPNRNIVLYIDLLPSQRLIKELMKAKHEYFVCKTLEEARQYLQNYGELIKVIISSYYFVIQEELFIQTNHQLPILIYVPKRQDYNTIKKKCLEYGPAEVPRNIDQLLKLTRDYLSGRITFSRQPPFTILTKYPIKNQTYIVEISNRSIIYKSVEQQFLNKWSSQPPKILKILKIVMNSQFQKNYKNYQNQIIKKRSLLKYNKEIGPGNERRRFHGTKIACNIGINGKTTFCNESSCAVCNICKKGFLLDLSNGGLFGKGLYYSASAEKSKQYTKIAPNIDHRAIFLVKVVCGAAHLIQASNSSLTCPPNNMDCVIFDQNGPNKNETIVYNQNAVLPTYLILYK